jgi:succinyl-diaminopimelate desuccinylase
MVARKVVGDLKARPIDLTATQPPAFGPTSACSCSFIATGLFFRLVVLQHGVILREPLRPIAAWLDAHRSGMLDFARDLVAIPSENPPGRGYQDCVARIERELERLALPAERLADGLVVQSTHGAGSRLLYLSGHYDVVPAQSPSQFEPESTGDSLTGRGSADMKGAIAAMLYSVAAIAAHDSLAGGRIVVRCVPDEESGGARGTRALAESGLIDRSAIGVLTPEPTSGVI